MDAETSLRVLGRRQRRSRVITSPKHMKRLLLALQDNIAKYESRFGPIDLGKAGPQFPIH